MEHLDKGINASRLVSVLLITQCDSIPPQLLEHLDSSPFEESLKMLASNPDSCSNAFRYMLRLWRRWERLSMSNLGMIMFKSLCNENDKALMKRCLIGYSRKYVHWTTHSLPLIGRKRTKVLLRFLSGAVY